MGAIRTTMVESVLFCTKHKYIKIHRLVAIEYLHQHLESLKVSESSNSNAHGCLNSRSENNRVVFGCAR